MKKPTSRNIFIIFETVIFICFVVLDLKHMDSVYVKYAGIVMCFLWSLLRRDRWASSAFLFTLIADWFLLVRNDHYPSGVLAFIIVQSIYMYILYMKGCGLCLLIRACIFSGLLLTAAFSGQLSFLNSMVLFYFSMLAGNFISSLTNKDLKLFSSGLFLFICCDICVGLHNLLPDGRLYDIISYCMWLFYLPSQVLICLGSEKEPLK